MKKILFIGNSFTYYNDVPGIFNALCAAAGVEAQAEKVVRGGWYLSRYANPEDEMYPEILEAAKKEWDYVVLQDQSFNPAGNKEDFLSASRKLVSMFKAKQFVFYQTWAYEDGSEKLSNTHLVYDEMYEALKAAYQQAAAEHGALCVPVGDAFKLAHDQYQKLQLYRGDSFHPCMDGSYLIACMFFAALTGKNPLDCITTEGVTPEHAVTLRKIAHDTALPIPAEATSILYIGNSHTYYNDLPAMVTTLAHAVGKKVYTQRVVRGGWKLSQYADPQNEMHPYLRSIFPQRTWDYIVLQAQALTLAQEQETFYAAVHTLCEMMKDHCGQFALYQTHGYTEGSEKILSIGHTFDSMHQVLRAANIKASQDENILLIPFGDAFADAIHDGVDMHRQDAVHLTADGTYLAACLHCAVLLNIDPLTLPTLEGVDVKLAPYLRQLAHNTWKTTKNEA